MLLLAPLLLVVAAGDVQPAFLSSGAPRAVRLVVEDAAPVEAVADYRGWSALQLKVEQKRLASETPGLGLPITLMGVGGGVLIQALYILVTTALSSGLQNDVGVAVLAGIGGTAGATIGVLGGILLQSRLPERQRANRQLDLIDRELEQRQRRPAQQPEEEEAPEQPIIGPPPVGPPPLPLPPMPISRISIHVPILFARF